MSVLLLRVCPGELKTCVQTKTIIAALITAGKRSPGVQRLMNDQPGVVGPLDGVCSAMKTDTGSCVRKEQLS